MPIIRHTEWKKPAARQWHKAEVIIACICQVTNEGHHLCGEGGGGGVWVIGCKEAAISLGMRGGRLLIKLMVIPSHVDWPPCIRDIMGTDMFHGLLRAGRGAWHGHLSSHCLHTLPPPSPLVLRFIFLSPSYGNYGVGLMRTRIRDSSDWAVIDLSWCWGGYSEHAQPGLCPYILPAKFTRMYQLLISITRCRHCWDLDLLQMLDPCRCNGVGEMNAMHPCVISLYFPQSNCWWCLSEDVWL